MSGTLRLADPASVAQLLVVEGRKQLLDMERDPVRPQVDGRDDVARRRQLATEDQRRRGRRLLEGQRLEPGLLGGPLAQQPRSPLAVERVARELVGAVAAEAGTAAARTRAGRARR